MHTIWIILFLALFRPNLVLTHSMVGPGYQCCKMGYIGKVCPNTVKQQKLEKNKGVCMQSSDKAFCRKLVHQSHYMTVTVVYCDLDAHKQNCLKQITLKRRLNAFYRVIMPFEKELLRLFHVFSLLFYFFRMV